jgi:hypothetical protein
MRIYDLGTGEDGFPNLRHDSIHVMTGFGIGVAEEMRVAIVEQVLVNSPERVTVESLVERAARVRELFIGTYLTPQFNRMNVSAAGLQSTAFNHADAMTQPLAHAEITDLYQAARDMQAAIRQLTGKPYYFITPVEFAGIDFKDVDFTAQMNNIKLKHMLPRNAQVEQATAQILHEAAAAQGRSHDMPAAGSPWVGPLRKGYGA